MRPTIALTLLVLAAALSACGSGKDAHDQPPPEQHERVQTFADPLIGTKDKAQRRTEDAIESHRQALDQQIRADEGETPGQ
jgi:hypothetical protein